MAGRRMRDRNKRDVRPYPRKTWDGISVRSYKRYPSGAWPGVPLRGMKDDDDKDIDLTKQEYWETGKRVPILGPNGPEFLIQTLIALVVGLPTAAIAGRLVYGEWPAFVLWLVQ